MMARLDNKFGNAIGSGVRPALLVLLTFGTVRGAWLSAGSPTGTGGASQENPQSEESAPAGVARSRGRVWMKKVMRALISMNKSLREARLTLSRRGQPKRGAAGETFIVARFSILRLRKSLEESICKSLCGPSSSMTSERNRPKALHLEKF